MKYLGTRFFLCVSLFCFLVASVGLSAPVASPASSVSPVSKGLLECARVFDSFMVIPHGKKVPVWGKALPLAEVEVEFKGQKLTAKADSEGAWSVELAPLKPDSKGALLKVSSGGEVKEFKDVLVGEVWLASGQSNMAFKMSQFGDTKEAIAQSAHPEIRLMNLYCNFYARPNGFKKEVYDQIIKDGVYSGTWALCDPSSVARNSAVAYFFAKALQKEIKMPVGIICNAVGGTWMESWLPREVVEREEKYAPLRDGVSWLEDKTLPNWSRTRAGQEVRGLMKEGVEKPKHPYAPTLLFEEGTREFAPFPVTGVIWYQGESNAEGDMTRNTPLMKEMIEGWRAVFKQEKLPFLMVQLPRINSQEPMRLLWPEFRESQQEVASQLEGVELVCAYDLGGKNSDVHPARKAEVGARLADVALNKVYGQTDKPLSSQVIKVVPRGKNILLETNATSLKTLDGKEPMGFEVAGEKTQYYPAKATLMGGKIALTSPDVAAPVAVRYLWSVYGEPNLVNEKGLPLFPFRSTKEVKEEPASPWGKFPKGRKVKVACIGDSITFGYGIKEEAKRYPQMLGTLLGERFEVKNFGNSGKTAGDYPSEKSRGRWYGDTPQFKAAADYKADIYICNLGINDTGNWWDPALFEEGYKTIVKTLSGKRQPAFIVWGKLGPDYRGAVGQKTFPGNVFEGFKFNVQDNKSALNRPEAEKIIGKMAKSLKLAPLDAYKVMAKEPACYPDGLHPNEEGARKIAEFTYKFLAPAYKLPALPKK